MAAELEFGLLGPLEVRREGVPVPIPAGRQRALLAALLLNPAGVSLADDLIDMLWDCGPPVSARAALHNYVRRLRQALGDHAHERIVTRPQGYLISVAPGGLDVTRFEELLGAARAASRNGEWACAAGQARAALALWRGEPLADTGSDVLASREVPRLAELRLQATELSLEAGLRLGELAEAIGELRSLVARHPLRERLHGLLMLALYLDARQGEALATYQQVRSLLAEELGTDPGPGLRELHQQILIADPSLVPERSAAAPRDTTEHPEDMLARHFGGRQDEQVPVSAWLHEPDKPQSQATAPGGAAIPVPRQLPPTARPFTGRQAELAALTRLLDRSGERTSGTIVISAIGGTAGVGKTALAVRWAHQVVDRFPDGQLYVNLRGYDPGRPMTAADALAGFLKSLGVAGPDIPAGEDERAALYRSLLAGRRMLVLLDNASEGEQIRPLLPGSPACAVVVTSRDTLAGLVARDGAERLDLSLMPAGDAVGLLRALIGARVDADLAAAGMLAERCCGLPLALRVAAELAAARPARPLAELADELADQHQRLDKLKAGEDPRTAMRAVFSWSYRYLDAAAARAFRLLGLHPGPDFDVPAAAALTGADLEQAGRLLDVLARAHLVYMTRQDRFGLHDLLRAHARELAAARDGEDGQRAALSRLFDYYLAAAAAAMDTLAPAERHRRPSVPAPVIPLPPLNTPDAARAWLDAERASLIAMAGYTSAHGWPGHTTQLSAILFRFYHDIAANYTDALALHTHALHAAEQSGDRAGQADALLHCGMVDYRLGRFPEAAGQIERASNIYRDLDDRRGQARAHTNLGVVHWGRARYQLSAGHFRQALALHRDLGDRFGQATVLDNLGTALGRQGRYQEAAGHHEHSLAIHRELGHRRGEARARANLGMVLIWQGRHEEAAGHLELALATFRESGDGPGEADVLNDLGARPATAKATTTRR